MKENTEYQKSANLIIRSVGSMRNNLNALLSENAQLRIDVENLRNNVRDLREAHASTIAQEPLFQLAPEPAKTLRAYDKKALSAVHEINQRDGCTRGQDVAEVANVPLNSTQYSLKTLCLLGLVDRPVPRSSMLRVTEAGLDVLNELGEMGES